MSYDPRPLGNAATGVRCGLESGDRHLLLAGCDDCNARQVAQMSLERVEEWYRGGYIRQAFYEAYMHCWATGAPRFSSLDYGWTEPPNDREVIALVALIREAKNAEPA